jgi:phosphate-selective porin OprO/OprP
VSWALKKAGARLSSRKHRPAATIVICFFLASAFSIAARADAASAIDRIYGAATLYENPSNPTIQKFAFSGRFQLDYYNVDADQGKDSGLEIRRWRMGFKGDIFRNFNFRIEGDFSYKIDGGNDLGSFYKRLTDCYVGWKSQSGFGLKIGKQSVAFTLDGHTSSNNLYTTERSVIGNNIWFPQEYMPGASVSGEHDRWRTFFGLFSAGSKNGEFGNFDGSWFGLFSLGYDFSGIRNLNKGSVVFDFVYQPPDIDNTFTLPNEYIGSTSLILEKGRWGLQGDISGSLGYATQGNLFGFLIMPLFDITEKLQAVVSYSTLDSSEPRGIRSGRYADRVVAGNGDHYRQFYAGLNYFVDGHRLKFQLGLDWTRMDDSTNSGGDYRGLGTTLALRTNW